LQRFQEIIVGPVHDSDYPMHPLKNSLDERAAPINYRGAGSLKSRRALPLILNRLVDYMKHRLKQLNLTNRRLQ
jgi:hypothetical protein